MSAYEYTWGVDRTGYYCHLKFDIDFAVLESNFELPGSIVMDIKRQTLDCLNTYSLIKKS